MATIQIYKGDDTDFAGLRGINFVLESENSIEGFAAEFRLQCHTQVIPDISDGTFSVSVPSETSKKMHLGECFGKLTLIDTVGRRQTIMDEIPFEVVRELITGVTGTIDDDGEVINPPDPTDGDAILTSDGYTLYTADGYEIHTAD